MAGIGVGGVSNLIPIYISELAPPAIRGRLVGLYEMGWQIGGVVGFWINVCNVFSPIPMCIANLMTVWCFNDHEGIPRTMDHPLRCPTHPSRHDVCRTFLYQGISTLVNVPKPACKGTEEPLLDPQTRPKRHVHARRSLRHRRRPRTSTLYRRPWFLATLPSPVERSQSNLPLLPRLLYLLPAKHIRNQRHQLLLSNRIQVHRRHRHQHLPPHYRRLWRRKSSRNSRLAILPNR